jgi:hypothetical protein
MPANRMIGAASGGLDFSERCAISDLPEPKYRFPRSAGPTAVGPFFFLTLSCAGYFSLLLAGAQPIGDSLSPVDNTLAADPGECGAGAELAPTAHRPSIAAKFIGEITLA